MDRDALVARLRRAFGGDTPRDASHDSAALEAAARLERAARPDDVEAWALIALLYWQRCLATPHGSEREYTSVAALTRSLRPALDPLPTRLPMPTSDPVVLVASCADHVADLLSRRAFKVMEQPGFATDAAAQTQAAAVLGEASMLTRALGPSALAIYGNLGAVLMARYRATGQVAHLDQAVAAWRRAVAAPGTRQDVVAVTSNLATGYEARYEVRGRAVDLDRAVEARRRAAAMAGGDRSLHLIALAEDLRRRHARTGSARDADDAVCSAEAALAAAVTPEERRVCAQKLAAVLTARYDLSHARADLDRSIEVMGDAVMQDAGSGSPKIAGILGLALFQRFKDFESVADLDTAIDVLRGASLAGDGPNLGFLLVALGDALRARYQLSSRLADLDEAITVGRRAVADDVADPEALGEPRADLSMSFRLRFERTADPADLDQAVEFGEAGVAVTPPGHTDRARRLAAAGIALALRGHTRGELSDIDRGLEYIRAVILPAPSTERPGQLSNLASALLWRFFLLRQREDLDAAAEAIRAAVEALPLDRSKTAVALTNLNGITAARFDDSGAPAVLDEAVDLIRRVLGTLTPTDPICPEVAEGLADALLGRHRHGGGDGDAEERLELLRYVATATPPGDVRVGGRWQALGDALSTRYHRTGGSADLDETIDAMRHAVDSTGMADPALPLRFAWLGTMLILRSDRAGVDNDLREAEILARRVADLPAGTGEDEDVAFQETFVANALLSAFERQGLLADIDAAVEHARRAVELLPVGEESPERLGTLGVALCTRWERTGVSADLDEAVAMCRKALTVQSPDDEAYAGRLVNLGSALRLRCRRDGNGADLDEAVDLLQRATATAAPERQRSALSALSLALHARFEHAGQMADVDAAVVAIREAVARTPADNPALAGYLSNLGYVVQRRYEHIGRGADLAVLPRDVGQPGDGWLAFGGGVGSVVVVVVEPGG